MSHPAFENRRHLPSCHGDYRATQPGWSRSKIHHILRDRAYIGEVFYQEAWHAGSQPPLIERTTWNRVQTLLGVKIY